MKKFLYCFIFACSAPTPAAPKPASIYFDTLCSETTIQERANFILTCAKNANPMSDEEGEDLVKQCEKTATNLFCSKVPWAVTESHVGIPCSEVTDEVRKKACNLIK